MNALAFDTLAAAKRLESAGFSRAQAEALAEEQAKLVDERIASKNDIATVKAGIEALRLETKADIEALRLETKADIEALRLSARADLAETKADLLKWMVGSIGIQTVVIIGAVTALVRLFMH